jgi:hypothetical protein
VTIAPRTPQTNLRHHVERRPQEYALCFVGLTERVMEPSRLVESVDRRRPVEHLFARRASTFPART